MVSRDTTAAVNRIQDWDAGAPGTRLRRGAANPREIRPARLASDHRGTRPAGSPRDPRGRRAVTDEQRSYLQALSDVRSWHRSQLANAECAPSAIVFTSQVWAGGLILRLRSARSALWPRRPWLFASRRSLRTPELLPSPAWPASSPSGSPLPLLRSRRRWLGLRKDDVGAWSGSGCARRDLRRLG